MIRLTQIPSGSSRLAAWMKSVHRSIEALRITSVAGGKVRHSSRGTMIVVKPGRGTKATSSGIRLRGEYVPGNTYNEGDMVVIFTGPSTGTYICLQNGTTSAPANGTSWISLPMGSQIGAWT